MLTGSYQKMNPYGDVTTPTAGTEFLTAAKVAAQEPFLLIPGVEESFPSIRKNVDLLEYYQSNPDRGFGRRAGDFLASVAGSSINPISLGASAVLGPAAGFAVKGIASLTGKFAPALLSKAVTPLAELLPNTPSFVGSQTAGGIAANTVKNYSKLFGFMLPEEIAATKDRNAYQFDWLGGIEAAAVDGGLTLALTPLAYLFGHSLGKIRKGRNISEKIDTQSASSNNVDIPPTSSNNDISQENNKGNFSINNKEDLSNIINVSNDEKLYNMVDGTDASMLKEYFKRINREEGYIDNRTEEWMKDYIYSNDTNENLTRRAVEILYEEGHPVNQATEKVMFNILRKEDVTNLNNAFMDRLASGLSDGIKSDLSDYIVHNRIDSLKSGVDMSDGIDGVVSLIKNNIKMSSSNIKKSLSEKIENLENFLLEEDKYDNRYVKNKSEKLSQKSILEKVRVENGELKYENFTIPENLKSFHKIIDAQSRIKSINDSIEREKSSKNPDLKKIKIGEKDLKHNLNLIKSIGKVEIQSLDEEVSSIRSGLIKNGKLIKHIENNDYYKRLVDISNSSNEAFKLLKEIELMRDIKNHSYDYADFVREQEDLAHVLNMINSVVKSTDGHLADSQAMMQYMRNRASHAEGMQPKIDEVKVPEKLSGEAAPSIEEFDKQMESAPAEVKQEYDLLKSKLKEVTGKQNVLKNLVSCVLGSRNGRV